MEATEILERNIVHKALFTFLTWELLTARRQGYRSKNTLARNAIGCSSHAIHIAGRLPRSSHTEHAIPFDDGSCCAVTIITRQFPCQGWSVRRPSWSLLWSPWPPLLLITNCQVNSITLHADCHSNRMDVRASPGSSHRVAGAGETGAAGSHILHPGKVPALPRGSRCLTT